MNSQITKLSNLPLIKSVFLLVVLCVLIFSNGKSSPQKAGSLPSTNICITKPLDPVCISTSPSPVTIPTITNTIPTNNPTSIPTILPTTVPTSVPTQNPIPTNALLIPTSTLVPTISMNTPAPSNISVTQQKVNTTGIPIAQESASKKSKMPPHEKATAFAPVKSKEVISVKTEQGSKQVTLKISTYTINVKQNEVVLLSSDTDTCDPFYKLSFKAKKDIWGSIVVKELFSENYTRIPMQDTLLIFGMCEIMTKDFSLENIHEIVLQTKCPEAKILDNKLEPNNVELYTGSNEDGELNSKVSMNKVDQTNINNNEYFIYENALENLPRFFGVSGVRNTLTNIEENSPTVIGNIDNSSQLQNSLSFWALIGLLGYIAGILTFKKYYHPANNSKVMPRKQRPIFW